VSFDDGAIDAGGQAKIVGVEDEATHRNESSSLGVAKKLCEMKGRELENPSQHHSGANSGRRVPTGRTTHMYIINNE
jgi:hypothetical protein